MQQRALCRNLCVELDITDPAALPAAVRKLKTALQLLPKLEGFVSGVVNLVRQQGMDAAKHTAGAAVPSPTLTAVTAELQLWVKRLQRLYQLQVGEGWRQGRIIFAPWTHYCYYYYHILPLLLHLFLFLFLYLYLLPQEFQDHIISFLESRLPKSPNGSPVQRHQLTPADVPSVLEDLIAAKAVVEQNREAMLTGAKAFKVSNFPFCEPPSPLACALTLPIP